ncbi:uncharacterized protein PS065_020184 [Dugong dugon]
MTLAQNHDSLINLCAVWTRLALQSRRPAPFAVPAPAPFRRDCSPRWGCKPGRRARPPAPAPPAQSAGSWPGPGGPGVHEARAAPSRQVTQPRRLRARRRRFRARPGPPSLLGTFVHARGLPCTARASVHACRFRTRRGLPCTARTYAHAGALVHARGFLACRLGRAPHEASRTLLAGCPAPSADFSRPLKAEKFPPPMLQSRHFWLRNRGQGESGRGGGPDRRSPFGFLRGLHACWPRRRRSGPGRRRRGSASHPPGKRREGMGGPLPTRRPPANPAPRPRRQCPSRSPGRAGNELRGRTTDPETGPLLRNSEVAVRGRSARLQRAEADAGVLPF